MARSHKKQVSTNRDTLPVRIGRSHLDIISQLAKKDNKSKRVVIEESLDLAWKMRRIDVAQDTLAHAPTQVKKCNA